MVTVLLVEGERESRPANIIALDRLASAEIEPSVILKADGNARESLWSGKRNHRYRWKLKWDK